MRFPRKYNLSPSTSSTLPKEIQVLLIPKMLKLLFISMKYLFMSIIIQCFVVFGAFSYTILLNIYDAHRIRIIRIILLLQMKKWVLSGKSTFPCIITATNYDSNEMISGFWIYKSHLFTPISYSLFTLLGQATIAGRSVVNYVEYSSQVPLQ